MYHKEKTQNISFLRSWCWISKHHNPHCFLTITVLTLRNPEIKMREMFSSPHSLRSDNTIGVLSCHGKHQSRSIFIGRTIEDHLASHRNYENVSEPASALLIRRWEKHLLQTCIFRRFLRESLGSLQFQALQEKRVVQTMVLLLVLQSRVFCFLCFLLGFGHLFEQTTQNLERNSLWASLVLIALLSQVLKPFDWLLEVLGSDGVRYLSLQHQGCLLTGAAWLILVTLAWQHWHMEGGKDVYMDWRCLLSLHFSRHVFKTKIQYDIKVCEIGSRHVCMGICPLPLKYDHSFILYWKICRDMLTRKFRLRHIFALKIIKELCWELQSSLYEDFKGLYNKIWENVLIVALMTHHVQPLPPFSLLLMLI